MFDQTMTIFFFLAIVLIVLPTVLSTHTLTCEVRMNEVLQIALIFLVIYYQAPDVVKAQLYWVLN